MKRFPSFAHGSQLQVIRLLAAALLHLVAASGWAVTPAQASYDVWGGNTLDLSKSYYDVDKMSNYVKLGSTNRTATFSGRYNYYVVAVRKTAVLYLDAAQTSTGAYYTGGSLAVGNVNDTANGALGAPDRVYLVLNGPAAGSSASTYGSYAIFYNTGSWTSMRFIVYEPQSGPGLSGQPKKQLAATGDTAKFAVTGIGTEPMYYQWRKDGVNLANAGRIAGATATNLTLASLELADTGGYSVVITNQYGSITSAPNALTVAAPAQASYDVWGGDSMSSPYYYYNVNTMPGYVKLGTANRTATFNGKYNYYVVAVKKTDLLFLDAAQKPGGAFYNNSSLATGSSGGGVLGGVQGPPDGRYLLLNGPGAGASPDTYGAYAVFYNTAGWTNVKFFVYSPDAVPDISQQPESQTVAVGATVRLSVTANSDAPLRYQWRRNGTNLANGGRVSGVTDSTLSIATAAGGDSGAYSVVVSNAYGSVTSAMAVLNVVTPPSSFVLLDYFNPLVEGNEWHFTGTDYDGQSSTRVDRVANRGWPVTAYTGRSTPHTYTTNLVRFNRAYGFPTHDDWDDFFGDQGTLAFWGHNDGSDFGRVDGGLVLPPSLTLGQSASVTRDFYDRGVYQGSVTFKLTAVSWGSVTVPAGTFEDCLKVRIVITGGGESETQDEWWARGVGAVKHRNVPDNGEEQLDLVSYSVVAPVRIVTPPRAQTNSLGGIATFAVVASGSPPLSYQWRKNDVDLANDARLAGATSNLLVIAGLEFADAGSYSVRVANDHDSVVSSAAVLTVNDSLPPVVNVTSHVEAQLQGGAKVTLAGTASDADRGDNGIASVTVNGIRATSDTAAGNATANWSRMFNLVLGTNKITVVARDGRGNAATNLIRLLADTARPAASITAPVANARLSNAVATVQGKAGDNLGLVEVRYQLNGTGWATATPSPIGWSNWSATLNLAPGTNTLNAYAVDVAGNRSLTNTVKFIYVLTSPLGLQIEGNGKVAGGAHGQLFELGKAVKLTATPATGYILTNWLVTVDGLMVLSTNKVVPFLMASNTVVTARFVDVAKPTLTLTAPKLNQRWSNEVFTVAGKVTDNNTNGGVWYQLNGGAWTSASGWTNWSASVNLIPGTNHVKAYAADAAANRSTTNSVNFVRVLTAPLSVAIIGNGKVNGVTDGQLFEIGKSVAPTVTPATGWILTNWLVTVDGNTIRSTNKAVPFLMASNTAVTARFVDVAKPTLTLTAPKLNQRWSNEVFTVAGKVTDNNTNGGVWYQLNGGAWTSASGWTNWSASVNLIPGTNHVKAYAADAAANRSTTNSVNVIYVLTYCLADYFYSAPLGSRLIYDGLDWDGFPAQLKVEIKDADYPLVTYSGTTTVSNYVVNVLHIESAYGTYISGTGQFFSYDDWDEYFIMGGCTFGWVGSDDDDESLRVDRGFLITNRVAIGQTTSITRGIYLDGSYAGQATLKLQLLDVSTVTVPAGTFPGCLRVRLTVSAGGESQAHDDWLAPGIGMVKQQGVSGDGAAERWELIRSEPPTPGAAPLAVNVAPATQTPLQWIVPDDGSAVADGQMQWRVAGPNGQAFVVEGSSDLRDWIPLHTNAIPAEGLQLSIPVGPQPAQFFRLRAVPP